MQQIELRGLDNFDAVEGTKVPKISIVIPARNEENDIGVTLERTIKSLVDSKIGFQVLIVDDGSSDNTFQVVKSLAARDLRVVVVRNHSNFGKGLSLKRGFYRASTEVIVMMDADGQHMPEEIPKLIWPILNGEADLVLGSRFLDKSNGMPIQHLLGNKVTSSCFNLLHDTNFTDVLMGFRACRRGALDLTRLNSNGYLIEVEMLRSAVKKRVKIIEVPASCIYPKKSSVFRGIVIVARILIGLFQLRLVRR